MRSQRGMSLLETLAAMAILGICLLMGFAVVAWADQVEERATRRVLAAELAHSTCERLRVVSYPSVQSRIIDLSGEPTDALLPEPTLEIVVDEDEDRGLKHVAVVVGWAGREPGSLRLETLVSRSEPYR